MKINLTRSIIEEAQQKQQRTLLWDTLVPGFYAEVRENGKASYLLRYTNAEHLKQTITIGPTDIIKLEDARTKARELLSRVYLGDDPAQRRDDQKTSPTLAELVANRYLPHAKAHKKSWKTDDQTLRKHILPALGTLKINAITVDHITTLHLAMSDKSLSAATCNHVVTLLRGIFNLAIKQWKLPGLKENPACAVQQFKVNNLRQTFLDPSQIEQLLRETLKCQKNIQLPYIISLLSLTGVRMSNALQACWSEFNEANQTWVIPMTKSGRPQTIQLSNEVIQLIQILPSRGQSEYLFPNPLTGKPFGTIFHSWDTARKNVGLSHVRLHDLRHTFASLLINAGHSLYVVQKALGHHNPKVTMRYAHLADDTLKQANNAVGGLIKAGINTILKSR